MEPKEICLVTLHIKLGLIENFLKAMYEERRRFQHLKQKFPNLNDAKFKEEIFIEPQINLLQ